MSRKNREGYIYIFLKSHYFAPWPSHLCDELGFHIIAGRTQNYRRFDVFLSTSPWTFLLLLIKSYLEQRKQNTHHERTAGIPTPHRVFPNRKALTACFDEIQTSGSILAGGSILSAVVNSPGTNGRASPGLAQKKKQFGIECRTYWQGSEPKYIALRKPPGELHTHPTKVPRSVHGSYMPRVV